MNEVKTNSLKAWFLAARPKTLTGALVPVAIALCLAWRDLPGMVYLGEDPSGNLSVTNGEFQWVPAILCMLFACMMQIDANLVNDYFDCLKGVDGEDRLGPERACSQGWITLPAMKRGLIVVTVLSALIGLPLIYWGGWEMVLVGIACIIFCYLYTTLLSRKAMGDVLVLVFFGIVPVCVTYYLQVQTVTIPCLLLSLGCGLATDKLLVINNFRDRDTDKEHGKITLITLIGERTAILLYMLLGICATALACIAFSLQNLPLWASATLIPYVLLMCSCGISMYKIRIGRELNRILGNTALSILLYGVGACTTIILFS